jgi:ParB-like chromosome segregation protein Spo0J
MVDPRRINPLHRVRRKKTHLPLLVALMRQHGWRGRPILVEQVKPGHYQAWTGTHRLAAAKRAPLRRVPVVLINLKKWAKRWGPIQRLAIDMVDDDEDKYVALLKAGDKMAADIIRQEVELNFSADAQGCL